MDRRSFVRLAGGAAVAALAPACREPKDVPPVDELVRFPGKTPLRLLTDRPPQLETPLRYFRQDFTPNDAFFVRWHLSGIPLAVNPATHRLRIGGHVERALSLSLDDLRSFEPVTFAAVNQCSGNARSLFGPRVPGGQWGQGAIGNANWTGVRLRDLLDRAGVRAGAQAVTFSGLDRPPLASVPAFVKALGVDRARDGEVLVAWAMNGGELPLLNGYPLRLVVPGWYATYWVKALEEITVLDRPFDGFWMKKTYLVPRNPAADEAPAKLAEDPVPITRMAVRSFFVRPEPDEPVRAGRTFRIEGLALDGGSGIRRVEVSVDGGASWQEARLDTDYGRYAWRRFTLDWRPASRGQHVLLVRATNREGDGQPTAQWNHSGYQRAIVERAEVTVTG